MTMDPIKDGMNWYVYCENNPLRYVDPTGLAPRNLTPIQRSLYMRSISSITPATVPNNHDCADTALYVYNRAMEYATGQKDAYKNISKNGKQLNSLRNIQVANLYGKGNQQNKIISYYKANGSGQTYDSSNADDAFNSANVEVGSVGIYSKNPGVGGDFTGHTITVVGVTRNKATGEVVSIDYIEGHMSRDFFTGEAQEVHTFTREDGLSGSDSLQNRYDSCTFEGWGEFQPQ